MRLIFVAVNFALATTQAERITMEEVAKAKASAGVSTTDLHMASVHTHTHTHILTPCSRILVRRGVLKTSFGKPTCVRAPSHFSGAILSLEDASFGALFRRERVSPSQGRHLPCHAIPRHLAFCRRCAPRCGRSRTGRRCSKSTSRPPPRAKCCRTKGCSGRWPPSPTRCPRSTFTS